MSILKIEGLTKSYGNNQVLKGSWNYSTSFFYCGFTTIKPPAMLVESLALASSKNSFLIKLEQVWQTALIKERS